MEYRYSGKGSLWYGSWYHHVCHKGKCTADRPCRSLGVDPSRKQRCCSQSCLLSQAQYDTSNQDNSQSLDYWMTIRHRCIDMWSWTEMQTFFSIDRNDCMNSASCAYRNMSARRRAQLVPIGMPTICLKTFPPKTTKMFLTRNYSMLMMSSSVYFLFKSECSVTK